MLTTTSYRLADAAVGGDLYERLRKWRDAGVSYQAISNLLRDEIGTEISQETLRRWGQRLGLDKTPGQAAS